MNLMSDEFMQALQQRVQQAVDRRLQEREQIAHGRLFDNLLDLWKGKTQFPWSLSWHLWPHHRRSK